MVNRKIQGKRSDNTAASTTPPPASSAEVPGTKAEPEPTPKQISVSQQSFDSQIDNFTKLIQVISTEAAYAPNENELKASCKPYSDLTSKSVK